MSKWKQYIVLGGILFLFQRDFVKQTFQSQSFLNTVLWVVGILLVIAVSVTVYAQKRRKKAGKNEDDGTPVL